MSGLPSWWPSDKPWIIQDCLEGMKSIPDNTVDLVVADPPYYRIMLKDWKNEKCEWDNRWITREDYLAWCRTWIVEAKRILKHNGSLYVFADDKNVSYLQVLAEELGLFLENHIVWFKPNNMPSKGWKNFNCYAPATERILFFSKEQRTHNLENSFYAETIRAFAPIIEYMKEQKRLIKELKTFQTDEEFNQYINEITGTKSVVSRHYFTYSQWIFPTKELYQKLQSINNEVFKKDYEELKKDYEELKKDYEELKKDYEELLRPFNPKENFTDVWTFNITSSYEAVEHQAAKPSLIIERIIETSSREGAVVLDPFLGSGTTLLACRKTGRIGLGFEINPEYESIIEERSMAEIPAIEGWY